MFLLFSFVATQETPSIWATSLLGIHIQLQIQTGECGSPVKIFRCSTSFMFKGLSLFLFSSQLSPLCLKISFSPQSFFDRVLYLDTDVALKLFCGTTVFALLGLGVVRNFRIFFKSVFPTKRGEGVLAKYELEKV